MKTLISIVTVSALATFLGGCHDPKNVSYGHITGDLSPELKGLSERPTDDHTAFMVSQNQNLRMLSDDFGRALYLDQPSRLHPYPIMSTGGQPR